MKSRFAAFVFQLTLCVFSCLATTAPADGAFLEKKFVVCQDRGRDVLCDSYVVKKNDYVTRLFKQRGEIAYRDFPMFLEIFKRLNPSVKDIDLIFPNQRILVPLRLIEPDTLEGQATGTVTIPLITITNIPRQLRQNSMNYVVQQGDCVSSLIAKKFGRYSTRSYKEGMKIFAYLNPRIKDLNLIHVGQTINIPVPAIRDASWYPEIFDDDGELLVRKEPVAEVAEVERIEVIEEAFDLPEISEPAIKEPATKELEINDIAEKEAVAEEKIMPEPPAEKVLPVVEPPLAEKTGQKSENETPEATEPETPPEPEPLTPLPSIFKKAGAIFGADLLDKGDYFFPRPGQADLALNLAATPVMEFDSGPRVLFGKENSISASDQAVVAAFWKNLQIVTISYDAPLRELLYTICQLLDAKGCENNFSINDAGVTATIRGELIYDNINGPGKVCVTLIDHAGRKLPDELYHYFLTKQVVVSEWIDSETVFGPVSPGNAKKPVPGYVIAPDTSHAKAFVKDFAAAFGMKYQENVKISFPYAGFQVSALSNLLTVSSGNDVLVDFGDLQGDAVESIETTGFQVLQIRRDQNYQSIAETLLGIMPVVQSQDPVFAGADRPRAYNASIQIPGRLITRVAGRGKIKMLMTHAALHDHLVSFLNQSGVKVMKIEK